MGQNEKRQSEGFSTRIEELQKNQDILEEQFLEAVRYLALCQQENTKLHSKMEKQEEYIKKIVSLLHTSQEQVFDRIELLEYKGKIQRENLIYELYDEQMPKDFFYPKIRAVEDTIEDIIKNRKSLSRFGDGEFAILFGRERAAFQRGGKELQHRLGEVLKSQNPSLLIGIADNYGSLRKFTDKAADDIRAYMTAEVRKEHLSVLNKQRVYENAYLTRPYALYRDADTENPRDRFCALQKLWEGREVIFVEGEKTRMGVGNDLFTNTTSIRRVICPAENAYTRYQDVLHFLQKGSRNVLYLLALGPMATVLAADLSMEGFQALDIGHLDLEYEWYRNGKKGPSEVKYKYNNEYVGGREVEKLSDAVYEQEILQKFL